MLLHPAFDPGHFRQACQVALREVRSSLNRASYVLDVFNGSQLKGWPGAGVELLYRGRPPATEVRTRVEPVKVEVRFSR
jgi:hypothetical protein